MKSRWERERERAHMPSDTMSFPLSPQGCPSFPPLDQLFLTHPLGDLLSLLLPPSQGGWLFSPCFTWWPAPPLLQTIYYLTCYRIYFPCWSWLCLPSARLQAPWRWESWWFFHYPEYLEQCSRFSVDKGLFLRFFVEMFHIQVTWKESHALCHGWAHEAVTAHSVVRNHSLFVFTSFTSEESWSLSLDHCILCLQNCYFLLQCLG